MPGLNQRRETEIRPAMEVRLGEVYLTEAVLPRYARHCIIWINGKRFEGTLHEESEEVA